MRADWELAKAVIWFNFLMILLSQWMNFWMNELSSVNKIMPSFVDIALKILAKQFIYIH